MASIHPFELDDEEEEEHGNAEAQHDSLHEEFENATTASVFSERCAARK
jgi:hypothetical protein